MLYFWGRTDVVNTKMYTVSKQYKRHVNAVPFDRTSEVPKFHSFVFQYFTLKRIFPISYDLFKIKYTSFKLSVWDKSFYLDTLFRLRVQTRLWKQTIRLLIVCFIYYFLFLAGCRDYRGIAVALLPPKLHRLLSNKTRIHSKNLQVYDVLSINTIQ